MCMQIDCYFRLMVYCCQNTAHDALSGWGWIEGYLMKHDSGEMEDYDADIDTLLVFVSLASRTVLCSSLLW